MTISVIVPAYNEEEHLPALLESLEAQTFSDFETIVADADSDDRTAEIASEHGARVVRGGRPARGRNAGASRARGRYLYFLDADVTVPRRFLEKTVGEMERRAIDLATCESRPDSGRLIDRALFGFANLFIWMNQFINPQALGYCIFVRKELFERVGGFDETIKLGEDFDFVRRAAEISPLRVLLSGHVNVSVRRMDKEGRWVHVGKTIYTTIYRAVKGEIREEIVDYEFGDFSRDRSGRRNLRRLLKWTRRLHRDLVRWAKRNRSRLQGNLADNAGLADLRRRFDELRVRLRDLLAPEEGSGAGGSATDDHPPD